MLYDKYKEVNVMIDMHCHILPGLDDGAKDTNESIAMLKESYNQGVKYCVSTSHCKLRSANALEDFLLKRQNSYNMLVEATKDIKIPQIILGAEVYLDNDISKYPNVEKLCIEGTKYMLVEFGANVGEDVYSEWLYNLIMKGITPIIAHIDRYGKRSEMVQEFDGLNIIYQVNNSSVLGLFGNFIKKLSDYPVVMGSDMHNTTTRPCDMKKGYTKLKKKIPDGVEYLYSLNAKKILGL